MYDCEQLAHFEVKAGGELFIDELQHHEYCNGRGYPNRLTLAQIYPPARLVAVVDVFSSLTIESSYRPICYSYAEAIEIMRTDIGHLDPAYLDVLQQLFVKKRKKKTA